MKTVTVVIPNVDDSGTFNGPAVISGVTTVGAVVEAKVTMGLPGPQGEKGDQGPGILSNIPRITASTDQPANPEVNDLWIDIS